MAHRNRQAADRNAFPLSSSSHSFPTPQTTSQPLQPPIISSQQPQGQNQPDQISLLVYEMPNYECLWNTRCRSYRDLNKKVSAWKEISEKLCVEGIAT